MPIHASARPRPVAGRGGRVADDVRRQISAGGVRFWAVTDFDDHNPHTVDKALQRMKASCVACGAACTTAAA